MQRDDATRLRAAYVPKGDRYGSRGRHRFGSESAALRARRRDTFTGSIPPRSSSRWRPRTPRRLPFPVDLSRQSAERIQLADATVDTVVVTWSLCSIENPRAALGEIRRVLKPGGRFIFVEHGLAPDADVQRWQNRLTPVWRRLAGGCHLNRPIADLIRESGFAIADLKTEYLPGPRPMTFMYEGIAHANDSSRTRS